MWFLVTLLGALLFGLSGFLMKLSSTKGTSPVMLLLGLYSTATLCFLIELLITGQVRTTLQIVIAGAIIGIGSVFGNYFFVKIFKYGPAGLSAVLVNINVLVIILISVFFYGESLSLKDVLAIVLLFAAISLLPLDKNKSHTITDFARWAALVLLTIILFFFRNGGLKITNEMNMNNTQVLFICYGSGVIWFTMSLISGRIRNTIGNPAKGDWISLICGLIAGFFSYSGIRCYAYALENGPASIISPVFSLYSLVIAITSILFLNEKMTRFQGIAFAGILGSLILLRI